MPSLGRQKMTAASFILARNRVSIFFVLATVVAVVGCATREEIVEPEPPSFGRPLVEPLPLRVGYALGPDVDREILAGGGEGTRFRLRLGPATRAAFGRVFAAAFTDAIDLAAGAPAPASAADLAATIRLDLASAWMQDVTGDGSATTTFELVFLNPDGSEESSWQVRGGAAGAGSRSAELAIRSAAAKVASELGEQPAIRSWLERRTDGARPHED